MIWVVRPQLQKTIGACLSCLFLHALIAWPIIKVYTSYQILFRLMQNTPRPTHPLRKHNITHIVSALGALWCFWQVYRLPNSSPPPLSFFLSPSRLFFFLFQLGASTAQARSIPHWLSLTSCSTFQPMSAALRSGRRAMRENLCRPGGVISTHFDWPPARQTGHWEEVDWTLLGREWGIERRGGRGERKPSPIVLLVNQPLEPHRRWRFTLTWHVNAHIWGNGALIRS